MWFLANQVNMCVSFSCHVCHKSLTCRGRRPSNYLPVLQTITQPITGGYLACKGPFQIILDCWPPELSRQSNNVLGSTKLGPHWWFASHPLSQTTVKYLHMNSILVATSESENPSLKNLPTQKLCCFSGQGPSYDCCWTQHKSTIQGRILTFYWPRLRPSYPIPAKKSPHSGLCSCLT